MHTNPTNGIEEDQDSLLVEKKRGGEREREREGGERENERESGRRERSGREERGRGVRSEASLRHEQYSTFHPP